MRRGSGCDVVHRFEDNQILKVDETPFPCNAVFNAAATKFNDEYILLLRVEDLRRPLSPGPGAERRRLQFHG